MPTDKIKIKQREIAAKRRKLQGRLADTASDLTERTRLVDLALTFMEAPQAMYLRCDDHQRRLLNQALFHALYVEDDKITGHELKEPFAGLEVVEQAWSAERALPAPAAQDGSADESGRISQQAAERQTQDPSALTGEGSSWESSLQVLLGGTGEGQGSTGTCMVGDTGIEPVTSTVSRQFASLDLWPGRLPSQTGSSSPASTP
jgi:hypothetical protein